MDDRTNTSAEDPHDAEQRSGTASARDDELKVEEAGPDAADATYSLIEIALFAPVDAVFSLMRDPRGAAARGRARVEQVLRQARALGELSIKFGAREIQRRTEGAAESSDADTKRSATRPTPHPDAGPAPDDVIADYDALSASQIVPMLSSLEPAERARVADYEAKSRGRQTILRKIDQLDGNGA